MPFKPTPPPHPPASAEPELAEQLGQLMQDDLDRVYARVAQLVRTRSRPRPLVLDDATPLAPLAPVAQPKR